MPDLPDTPCWLWPLPPGRSDLRHDLLGHPAQAVGIFIEARKPRRERHNRFVDAQLLEPADLIDYLLRIVRARCARVVHDFVVSTDIEHLQREEHVDGPAIVFRLRSNEIEAFGEFFGRGAKW